MAKLADTSTAQIALTFLVMNLERALALFFFSLLYWCQAWARQLFASLGYHVTTTKPPRQIGPDKLRSLQRRMILRLSTQADLISKPYLRQHQ